MALHRFSGTTPPGLSGGGGAGDFTGPASSTDNAIVRFDGVGGKTGQNSIGVLSDAGVLAGLTQVTVTVSGDEKVRLGSPVRLSSDQILQWSDDVDIGSGANSASIRAGTGSPEGAVGAIVGSLYLRTDGGGGTTLYVKESGTGNTGWVAK